MHVLQAAGPVTNLWFLPDSRRLMAGVAFDAHYLRVEVWPLADGDRILMRLPGKNVRLDRHHIAPHPPGDRCAVAWNGHLHTVQTTDGTLCDTERIEADEVIASPDGDATVVRTPGHPGRLLAHSAGRVRWVKPLPGPYCHLAGFLPGGEEFISVGNKRATVHAFATGDESRSASYPSYHVNEPQLSPDGRHLGVMGYHSMYVYDTATLARPRRISGSQSSGNFVSFAFHPDGRTLAVIHGGPTLVKMYDLDTLKLRHKFQWKLGPLSCVAFSPDGVLGAAGSQSGQVVLWDVDG